MLRIVIGWDNPAEVETIELLLNVDENVANVVTESSHFEDAAARGGWDVVVQALSFPTREESLSIFKRVHSLNDDVPVIGVWHPDEIVDLARFISYGLHSHLMRDAEGNFLFLLISMAAAAHSAAQAQRAKLLAERLRQEVDSVRRLQESVIPRDLPRPAGYNIAARYESSQINVLGTVPVAMAGGDYYDVFEVDDQTLILLVGDASGHGVKACMSIMTMHTLIRTIRSQQYSNTADFVTYVNGRLCSSEVVQDEGGFITLLYSTLDLTAHCLRWTSAGAPLPLLQDLNANEVVQLEDEEKGGLPLAMYDDWIYDSCEVTLPENSRLLIYTDGLEEAHPDTGEDHEEFGVDGIISSLKSSAQLPLDDALEKLFSDSSAYTCGHGRMDDTSVLLVERTG